MRTSREVGPEVLDGPCTVVYVTSSHCSSCGKAIPWLEEIESRTDGRVSFVKVVQDKDTDPLRYCRGFTKIKGWPFTIIYKDGKRVDFFYGYESVAQYKRRVVKNIREFMKGG